jgi:glutamate synthase (NADPH) small chain
LEWPKIKKTTLTRNIWLELGRKGTIAVNDDMQSSIPTIYAGGDIVRGGATVILAMGDGRRAAAAMDRQLRQA